MKDKKAFTLIELVSVLVILAILALIVTPLVLNIIRKARIAADKRSIDAYGRSIELAIADYLLDTGNFPTSIEELTMEYSGDIVSCSTTQLNSDSSVYLADCTVGTRTVIGYTYGKDKSPIYDAYEIGNEITYNNVHYYVIKNSGIKEATVTLLKAEPLTYDEVESYSSGIEVMIENRNGYGGIAYYSSENCYYEMGNTYGNGCILEYEQSNIKAVIDRWTKDKVDDFYIYESSLITLDDLIDNMGIIYICGTSSCRYDISDSTPEWIYSDNYIYWTKSISENKIYTVGMGSRRTISTDGVATNYITIRPVITISKSALN